MLAAALRSAARRQRDVSFALRAYAAPAAAPARPPRRDVPEGHARSDLRPTSCHIGLNRRRDLTLRADVKLTGGVAGQGATLAELFKNKRTALVGVPDMGPVCTAKHAPAYVQAAPALGRAGVDAVLIVAPGDAPTVAAWAAKIGASPPSPASSSTPAVGAVADAGDFARLLGVDAPPGAPTPTHRWSALVEDGILLKLHVEEAPGSVTVTSADEMVKCATGFFKG